MLEKGRAHQHGNLLIRRDTLKGAESRDPEKEEEKKAEGEDVDEKLSDGSNNIEMDANQDFVEDKAKEEKEDGHKRNRRRSQSDVAVSSEEPKGHDLSVPPRERGRTKKLPRVMSENEMRRGAEQRRREDNGKVKKARSDADVSKIASELEMKRKSYKKTTKSKQAKKANALVSSNKNSLKKAQEQEQKGKEREEEKQEEEQKLQKLQQDRRGQDKRKVAQRKLRLRLNENEAGKTVKEGAVIAVPEITIQRIVPEDEFFILATDGLW